MLLIEIITYEKGYFRSCTGSDSVNNSLNGIGAGVKLILKQLVQLILKRIVAILLLIQLIGLICFQTVEGRNEKA